MTDLYTRFISGVMFPLHERLKAHDTVAIRRSLEASQWWSLEQIQDLQLQRLRDLLGFAGERVPYYRQLFAELDFDPGQLSSLADLQNLPFLDKVTIRRHTEGLKAEGAAVSRFNTGGSSGEPLVFFIGKRRVSHDVAAKWRATRWWGVDIGDPEVVLWGSPIELGAQDRLRQIRDRLLRTRLLPAFEMSDAKIGQFLDTIQKNRPKMLFGYPSAISLLARVAKEQGRGMDSAGIKVAFVTSERLYDHQRQLIEEIFGCQVANGYGGRDAGFIAHQCPAGGMHLTAEDVIIELVDSQGHVVPVGQSGEIVVTHLATHEFPFVRYRTGDVAVLDDQRCSCGRGLPLLKEIQGRSTDFIVAADGTIMHGLALIYILRDIPQIENFKIIQENIELIRVLLTTSEPLTEDLQQRVVGGFQARLGKSVHVTVEEVASIPPEVSGKFRYVVSRVAM